MHYQFPISDVTVRRSERSNGVPAAVPANNVIYADEKETEVMVEGVAVYRTKNGNRIDIFPEERASDENIQHFLNSWGVVSILHQRGILNFHASAFMLQENAIMVCGDSGAGKSSLTAAFCNDGAAFISDDITPVVFENGMPHIQPIKGHLALREQTVKQIKWKNGKEKKVNPFNRKFQYELKLPEQNKIRLLQVVWLNVSERMKQPVFHELEGMEKFVMLRGEICAWEMLKGMPQKEALYMKQLAELSRKVRITRVDRPAVYDVTTLKKEIRDYLLS